MMELPSIFVFTHDSIALGEDGPTHQPVEQLWCACAYPEHDPLSPRGRSGGGDGLGATRSAPTTGPTLLVLTRQKVSRSAPLSSIPKRIQRGAYVLDGYAEGGEPD